jgi:uncharacterized protein YndB with AHSA1/START domain
MEIDVLRYLGAVTRSVETRDHDGRPAKVIKMTSTYDTDTEDLWEAITSPDRLQRWFMPISGELNVGGRYQLEGNAGGVITRCDKPRELNVTWEMGKDVSWVHVRLSSLSDGGSKLELEHIAHVPEEFWKQYGPGAVGVGWDLAFVGLRMHMADPVNGVDRAAGAVWPMSENGKDYVRRTSSAWARASADDGTPEADALASGDRTYAFYTGT